MDIDAFRRSGYSISTDRSLLQVDVIFDFLSKSSYWAQDRPFETVKKSIENSLCFGLYYGEKQVGFARIVTDFATFAWLCDVFILEEFRGLGLGKWLVYTVVTHPDLQTLKRINLATRDAQGLYSRYGFEPIPAGLMMARKRQAL